MLPRTWPEPTLRRANISYPCTVQAKGYKFILLNRWKYVSPLGFWVWFLTAIERHQVNKLLETMTLCVCTNVPSWSYRHEYQIVFFFFDNKRNWDIHLRTRGSNGPMLFKNFWHSLLKLSFLYSRILLFRGSKHIHQLLSCWRSSTLQFPKSIGSFITAFEN